MVKKRILIDAVYSDETRVVICENNRVQAFDYETVGKKQLKGNIYLGKIIRVEAALQAAFVEFYEGRHGFLPFSEIQSLYYTADDNDNLTDLVSKIKLINPPIFSKEEEQEDQESQLIDIDAESDIINDDIEVMHEDENGDLRDSSIENDFTDDSDLFPDEMEPEQVIIDEDEELTKDNQRYAYKDYKIQDVIKPGQFIVVQVTKEERGNKGASLTSHITLAGRYCVLMPNSDGHGGISKKIIDPEDRRRLKNIIEDLNLPENASVILRTAGAGRSKVDIKRDYDYLVKLWNSIREYVVTSKPPKFIHAEGDLIRRCIRDLYKNDVEEIVVQGEEGFKEIKEFMKLMIPKHLHKVKHYNAKMPIFSKFRVEEQLGGLYTPNSSLQSGGYIVINPTEALIAIDVNSGRSISEKNVEETALKTNLEAAKEIARQLRLRDLSGLIVIDFIDMAEHRNRKAVERALYNAIQSDKAKTQLGSISNFGLLEMSRQRLRPSLIETHTSSCTRCSGKGYIRSLESTTILILRNIENEICRGKYESINIYAHNDLMVHVLNNKRGELLDLERKYGIKILFHNDTEANLEVYSMEKVKCIDHRDQDALVDQDEIYNSFAEEEKNVRPPKKNWKKNTNYNSEQAASLDAQSNYITGNKPSHPKNRRKKSYNNDSNFNHLQDNFSLQKDKFRKKKINNTMTDQEMQTNSLLKGLWKRIID